MTDRKPRYPQVKQDQNPTQDAIMIQRQVERILSSQDFQATARQRRFLKFVVAETIAGRGGEIKGYTVATQVFGRGEDFHQATDPIVSIQANKLRRALERYYLLSGQNDPMRIDIPLGSYVPTFHERTDVKPDRVSGGVKGAQIQLDDSWPSVLVRPLQNLSGDPEKDFIGIGLAAELTVQWKP